MKVRINNYRRIKSAEFPLDKITLIIGANEAGKTSIAQAVGACLMAVPSPFKLTKKEAHHLVNFGEKDGWAAVEDDEGNIATVRWPSMEVLAQGGKAPTASPVAAGVLRLTEMDKKEAVKYLVTALRAMPTKEDLRTALSSALTPEETDKLIDRIRIGGWDSIVAEYAEQARDLKADWKAITNEAWGAQKAAIWRPEGMNDETLGMNEKELQQLVDDARSNYEKVVATQAVDADKLAALKLKAGKYPDLVAKKEKLEKDIATLDDEIIASEAALSAMPATDGRPSFPCPHCGKAICALQSGGKTEYKKEEQMSAEALKEARLKRARLEGGVQNQRARRNDAARELATVMVEGKQAQDAVAELEKVNKHPVAEAHSSDSISFMRTQFDNAEKRLKAWKNFQKAYLIHSNINKALGIAEELAPTGLRQKKLERVISSFNSGYLAELSKSFGLTDITVTADADVLYNGYRYEFLSKSAQFRVDTIIQVALAQLDGSSAVIIDAADIIIGADRAGLMKMLLTAKIPALVCMAMTTPTNAPALSSVGGAVYWLEKGVAQKVEGK